MFNLYGFFYNKKSLTFNFNSIFFLFVSIGKSNILFFTRASNIILLLIIIMLYVDYLITVNYLFTLVGVKLNFFRMRFIRNEDDDDDNCRQSSFFLDAFFFFLFFWGQSNYPHAAIF